MAELSYGKLGKFFKQNQLDQINIEDFLPQFVIREINKALNMGDFNSVKMEIPNLHVEFEGYVDESTNEPLSSRLAFFCDDGYAVLNYVGIRETTHFSIYKNDNFYEPSTDSVLINKQGVITERGHKIYKKEIEKGE